MSKDASRIGKLILVPAVITLAVTLLLLVGELQGWSPALFSRGDKPLSPSVVGIVWRPNVPLTESFTILSVFVAFAIVGLAIGILAWPALGRTLLACGLAARIPVALPMLVAMLGNWDTHYDARPSWRSRPDTRPGLATRWLMRDGNGSLHLRARARGVDPISVGSPPAVVPRSARDATLA